MNESKDDTLWEPDDVPEATIEMTEFQKPTKVERLFMKAKYHFDLSENLLNDWIRYRELMSTSMSDIRNTTRGTPEQSHDWVSILGLTAVLTEQKTLREARRHRRIANRLIKRISSIEGTILDTDAFRED